MCMFCMALPMVIGATAVAQGEQRKKLKFAEPQQQIHSLRETQALASKARFSLSFDLATPVESHRDKMTLSPMRINQLGALAFVILLIASAFYHTHLPG